jgi:hypothetical protein
MSKKVLWVLLWPSGHVCKEGVNRPCVFFTRNDALDWKRNSTYETLRIVRFEVPKFIGKRRPC